MSNFDASTFMSQTVDSAGSTQIEQPDPGEYQAVIDEITEKNFRVIDVKRGENPGPRQVLEVGFVITDDAVKQKLGREKITVRSDTIWLDMSPQGGLDMGKGKNVRLNQLRDAVGQNQPGWAIGNLSGAGPLMIRCEHQPNEKDPSNPYLRATRWSKIS